MKLFENTGTWVIIGAISFGAVGRLFFPEIWLFWLGMGVFYGYLEGRKA